MALYAFDGTWSSAKTGDDPTNSNVVRFRDAYSKHSGTKDFYVAGVGTRFDVVGSVLGGAFGLGELPRLNEAYDHLCARWAEGDHIIDIVGFSRGAATTLDFCNLIEERKIRKPQSDTVVEANPRIRFLGVWDVVAAFGLANLGATDLNIGHKLFLPKANLQYAFHAMALDERRPSFLPTRLHGACEVWFRGVHSDIGGGNTNLGLNDITFGWMLRKALAAHLPIDPADIAALHPQPSTRPLLPDFPKLDIRVVSSVDRVHYTVAPEEGCRTVPATCPIETTTDEAAAIEVGQNGIETLPAEFRNRVVVLASVAEAQTRALGFSFDDIREPMLSLIEGRIILVTNDQQLLQAREAVIRLITQVVANANKHQFHRLNEFFINEALFDLLPLYPFTD
jgi:hypothetical protein